VSDDQTIIPEKLNRKSSSGFVEGLKTEWALFWQTILGEDEDEEDVEVNLQSKDPFLNGKLETLNLEQIKAITKALSGDRKILNQRLESLHKEMNLNTAKLESLALVGGEPEDTLLRLNELNDLGSTLSEKLDDINERLKLARACEDELKKSSREL